MLEHRGERNPYTGKNLILLRLVHGETKSPTLISENDNRLENFARNVLIDMIIASCSPKAAGLESATIIHGLSVPSLISAPSCSTTRFIDMAQ